MISRTLGAVGSGKTKRPGGVTKFGVSGYLMESDVLIWDRATQTIWSQIDGKGVAGPHAGTRLEFLPVTSTTWGEWRKRHPKTKVLRGPGNAKRYGRGAYGGYRSSDRVMFSVSHASDRLKNRAIVTGLRVGTASACWSHDAAAEKARKRPEADRQKPLEWEETVGGTKFLLRFDPAGDSIEAFELGKDGMRTPYPALRLYWFAWFTFEPRTTVDGAAVDPRTVRKN